MQLFEKDQLHEIISTIDKTTEEILLLTSQAQRGEEIETEYLMNQTPALARVKVLLTNALSDYERVCN